MIVSPPDLSAYYLDSNPSGFVKVQRIRAQTNISGNYSWLYSGFASGTTPIFHASVETNNQLLPIYVQVVNPPDWTGVTIKVIQSPVVNVLGINVIGEATGLQSYVHLSVMAP